MKDLAPALVVLGVLLALAVPAQAAEPVPTDENAPRDEPGRDVPSSTGDDDAFRVGVLGGVGFPRPLALEGVVGLGRVVMVGAEYSFSPQVTIQDVKTRLWGASADLRVFPFQGAFFVGLRGGYQSLTAETTLSAANVGSYTETVDVGTWFVNPRIGFLWTWKPLALGVDAGVQIPVSTTVSRSSLLAVAAPELDGRITGYADTIGRTPIPTIDLLRIGLVF